MNNRTKKQGFFLLILTLGLPLFFSVQGWTHAVQGETGSGSEALCTSASYDDGEPMSYAAVEIIAPNSKLPFQSGRTDRNGYFCFRPDTPGRWKMTIKDADGHFVRLGTKVSKEMIDQK
ncbi:nickel transport protein [Candidatus Electrothrix communis]|uniref:Nickel transport protein n=1 Tax=Candidatus Electrothrix communis TaxID=1859133 RepID=A0A444J9U4_9BACT|nr:nickel transport protein [Candidatus Electrothrix communis]